VKLKAYRVEPFDLEMYVVPAWRNREWMDSLPDGFANRCLPLRIANESGWFILNSHTFTVEWMGYPHQDSLRVEFHEGEEPYPAGTNFGSGILTFRIPYLFRTEPGWNLHVRGPANLPKHSCSPLEGIVETDWSPMTFTMNWQLTEAFEPVVFQKGEPICQVVPVRRGELESVEPEFAELEGEDKHQYDTWTAKRGAFIKKLRDEDPEVTKQGWQREYFQGKANGQRFEEHQTKLRVREFHS
jgi:hypothetical protein